MPEPTDTPSSDILSLADIVLDQIARETLVVGTWYVGRGRHANVGLWDGQYFLTIGDKCGQRVIKQEPYFDQAGGCFQPFRMIDEGETMEAPTEKSDELRGYAAKLVFRSASLPEK